MYIVRVWERRPDGVRPLPGNRFRAGVAGFVAGASAKDEFFGGPATLQTSRMMSKQYSMPLIRAADTRLASAWGSTATVVAYLLRQYQRR